MKKCLDEQLGGHWIYMAPMLDLTHNSDVLNSSMLYQSQGGMAKLNPQ